jgi:hypothetical protein
MTFQENIVEKYMTRAMEEWEANPLAMNFLRRLAIEAPALFFEAAMKRLRTSEASDAHRFLAILALRHEELTGYLANPANGSREASVKLFKRFLDVDPSFDVKLARKLPDRGYTNHAEAFDPARCTRALDILDSTSRGRRLLPILGHLPNSSDQKVAAKATLFVGRRVQSPSWSANLLTSSDQRIRANAVEALWGLDTQPAVRLLEKCVEDRNNRVMGNALLGLHIVSHRSIESELLALARNGSPDRRSTSAWVMGKTAQERWTEKLTALVKDEHPQVRSMALRSLLEIRRHDPVVAEAPALVAVPVVSVTVLPVPVAPVVEAPVEAVPEPMLYKGPELRLDGSSFRLKR